MAQSNASTNAPVVSLSRRESVVSYVSDLISLTKPRIIVLLLISTICPMILAGEGKVSPKIVFWALLGGALISGSASAINCIWDRDIDAVMERTRNRPIPAGRLNVLESFIFALAIGALGLFILSYNLNPLAGVVALTGHLFYVFIYTMWLKRSTPQNIVIGGAAGAIPPLVGWVAVTGKIDLTAVLLFLIVFLWTPPHFWALAIKKNEDYKRAKVPMMPVIRGEMVTYNQMLFYALSLIPASLLLVYSHKALGWFSLLVMGALGIIFVVKIITLKRIPLNLEKEKHAQAWSVFGFSLLYLALFFVCLVVDATIF